MTSIRMNKIMRATVLGLTLLSGQAALAWAAGPPANSLTIYSTASPGAVPPQLYMPDSNSIYFGYPTPPIPGYAMVRQIRSLPIAQGRSEVKFSDVAARIDPTTVKFESLTDPLGTQVLEQNFRFDLVNQAKLLERFVDQRITVNQQQGDAMRALTGTLLGSGGAWGGGLILRQDDGTLVNINGYASIEYPALPDGLMSRPTLVWDVESKKSAAAEHQCRVSYQTSGITWWADYNLVFKEGRGHDEGALDLGAWVSILNQSGATYQDAQLKLVAGDVHRAPTGDMTMYDKRSELAMQAPSSGPTGFEEKSFFEYHLYTLGRPTTISDNSTKQIDLFPAVHDVECKRILVYYGLSGSYPGVFPDPIVDREFSLPGNSKIDVYLSFRNDAKSGLGVPLPSGRVRVAKTDEADGSLEFIGEDIIDHTPKDEDVLIKLGSAFDVVGERRQTDFRVNNDAKWMEESFEIRLRNHKDEAVTVLVKENMYRWHNWEIKQHEGPFEKADARTAHFPVRVEKDGEAVMTYTVRYTW